MTAMRPRLRYVAAAGACLGAVAWLLIGGLGQNLVYFRTASEAVAHRSDEGTHRFPLAGAVMPGRPARLARRPARGHGPGRRDGVGAAPACLLTVVRGGRQLPPHPDALHRDRDVVGARGLDPALRSHPRGLPGLDRASNPAPD